MEDRKKKKEEFIFSVRKIGFQYRMSFTEIVNIMMMTIGETETVL